MKGRVTAAGVACLVVLLTSVSGRAQQLHKECGAVGVGSVSVSVNTDTGDLSHPRNVDLKPQVEPQSAESPHHTDKMISVIAFGPVLGSMDSSEVVATVNCSNEGARVTAIITRSANYQGAAAKNVLWRPRIKLLLALRKPEVVLQLKWRMRLSNGVEVHKAGTSQQDFQVYPIVVTQVLRAGLLE
jgi:hypothetical protein